MYMNCICNMRHYKYRELLNKELPPTPGTTIWIGQGRGLEHENAVLKRENHKLRCQTHIWMNQVKRYREVANAAMVFTREITSSIERIKGSKYKMEEAVREAMQENAERDEKVSWSNIGNEF